MLKEKELYSWYVNNYKCKYYITQTIKTFQDGQEDINSYGIKIDLISKENSVQDSVLLNEIGINETDVRNYIKNLYNGQVTPKNFKQMLAKV